jgi:hypothetical protein
MKEAKLYHVLGDVVDGTMGLMAGLEVCLGGGRRLSGGMEVGE